MVDVNFSPTWKKPFPQMLISEPLAERTMILSTYTYLGCHLCKKSNMY